MKIKNTTFIQKHIEKVVVGAAGIILLGVVAYYFFGIPSKPFGVKLSSSAAAASPKAGAANGQQGVQDIGNLSEVLKKKADDLYKRIAPNSKSPVDPEDYRPPNYPQILTTLRATPITAGVKLVILTNYPLEKGALGLVVQEVPPYYLPQPPMPQGGRIVTGNVVLATGEDKTYASMEATFDQEAWLARLGDAAKKRQTGESLLTQFMAKQGMTLAGVYLEREAWDARARVWGGRTRIKVEGQPCYFAEQPAWDVNSETDRDKVDALIKSIKDNQALIQRPGFPPLDPASPPPALQDKPVAVLPGSDIGSPVKAGPLPPLRVWTHDLTVQSGAKYRYRLVASILNPLYGIPAQLLCPQQVKENSTRLAIIPAKGEIESVPWTEVVVPANFHCFFVESPGGGKASFEVWKVVAGHWVGQTFEAKVGDAIGSKQAEVEVNGEKKLVDLDAQKILVDIVDVPEPGHPERKIKAALLMGADGMLETRYSGLDANSIERKQVQDKARGVESAAPDASSDASGDAATPARRR